MLINNKSMITITENNSTLKNKKGCYMGDSYSVPEVYQNYLRNEFGVLEGYAGVLNTIGSKKLYGNGWSVRAIVDKIINCTLDDTADFVVIMAGTNDAHYAIANTYEGYEDYLKGKNYTKGLVHKGELLDKFNGCESYAYLRNDFPSDLEKRNDDINIDFYSIYYLVSVVVYITLNLNKHLNLYLPSIRVYKIFNDWLNK